MKNRLTLYVTDSTAHSLRAQSNLDRLCRTELTDFEFEVIDVLEQPERAQEDGVLVAPMLVRNDSESTSRIIGDLSDFDLVLRVLGRVRRGLDEAAG